MNMIPAIGAPNSPCRYFQENPEKAIDLVRAVNLALQILDRDGIRPMIGEAFTSDDLDKLQGALDRLPGWMTRTATFPARMR